MTRKDYELIANNLKVKLRAVQNNEDMLKGFVLAVEGIASAFRLDNHNFDLNKFVNAVNKRQ